MSTIVSLMLYIIMLYFYKLLVLRQLQTLPLKKLILVGHRSCKEPLGQKVNFNISFLYGRPQNVSGDSKGL